MKYKALMVDLDGTTVLPFTNTVTPKVHEAIKKSSEKVFVSVATGRLLPGVLPILTQLDLNGLCVIANGAQIYDPKLKTIVKSLSIDRDIAREVFTRLRFRGIPVHICDGKTDTLVEEFPHKHTNLVNLYVPDLSTDLIPDIMNELGNIQGITVVRLLGSKPGNESIEVAHPNATKQYGIYEVARREYIDPQEIIGVGDGYNDFPLLMACGLKIAMGNAVPELKAIADFVAPTVDEDGLATVIEKFILQT